MSIYGAPRVFQLPDGFWAIDGELGKYPTKEAAEAAAKKLAG